MGDGRLALRELEPHDRRLGQRQAGRVLVYIQSNAPSGTFRIYDGRAIVSYATDLIADPRQLIAVLAHELCHYRLAIIEEPPPGGGQAHELLTELTVAFAGFGAFAANAAFSFSQHGDTFSQGWRSQRSGYFSERTWAFALALFLTLKDERGGAKGVVKPSIAAMIDQAERYLERHPRQLAAIREIA